MSYRYIAAGLVAVVVLVGCDPTRRVPQGRYLLKQNKIVVTERSVDAGTLEPILKQKPNKRVLWVPIYLHSYNLPDPEKIPIWQARKNDRIDRKNVRRVAHGKQPLAYRRTRAEWLREKVGEAPVILDSTLTERTADQIRLYMAKQGWFNAQVSDSVELYHRRWFGPRLKQPRAIVTYRVVPGTAYRYRNIRFEVDEPRIQERMAAAWPNSLLKPGERVNEASAENERTRITDLLRDDGFLFFTRDLIHFSADTSVGGHQVDLVVRLERPMARKDRGLVGTPEGTRYQLKDIYIATYKNLRGGSLIPVDTLESAGYRFLYRDHLQYKTKALLHPIFLRPNTLFQQSDGTDTYRRLTSLNVFDRVDISYDTTGTGAPGLTNARITLLPGKGQNLSLEGFGTTRGGILGTSVSLGYRHRNLFGSLGSLSVQMSLGLEAQQQITGTGSNADQESTTNVPDGSLFNTVSIGPEVTFGFPRPFAKWFSKSSGSRLLINTLYNYQRRPDYTRTITKLSAGVQWNESRANTIGVFPVELNSIKLPALASSFEEYLIASNDPVLRASYTDHVIAGMRGVFTHSTPDGEKKVNSFFGRATLEWAGTLLHAIDKAVDAPKSSDTTGTSYYTLFNVRYAEFIKCDVDLRWRHTIHEKSSMAFRVAAGAGLPYGNLAVLPFETSFFVGGANGLRAWRARSIGPGSYNSPLVAYDRIGEIRLEGNAEYRFKLIGFLEGALFMDVGNIWNFNEDPAKPGARFSSEFLSEVAVGTGIGARLNFDFFIVRFDFGLQTKDPSLPKGERWLFEPKDQHEANTTALSGAPYTYKPGVNFNLGIGYPF